MSYTDVDLARSTLPLATRWWKFYLKSKPAVIKTLLAISFSKHHIYCEVRICAQFVTLTLACYVEVIQSLRIVGESGRSVLIKRSINTLLGDYGSPHDASFETLENWAGDVKKESIPGTFSDNLLCRVWSGCIPNHLKYSYEMVFNTSQGFITAISLNLNSTNKNRSIWVKAHIVLAVSHLEFIRYIYFLKPSIKLPWSTNR